MQNRENQEVNGIFNSFSKTFKEDTLGDEKNGSGYWIRTSDQVINSHLLYR